MQCCAVFSIDRIEKAARLCLVLKREERSSLAFIVGRELLLKCQLVHWYFGFVPGKPMDFRKISPHD